MKILYLWCHGNKRESELIRAELEEWKTKYDITPINYLEELQIKAPYHPKMLNDLWNRKYPNWIFLHNFYNKIYELSKSHDVLITNYGNVLHPEFVRSLNEHIYTVLISGDDPNGSEICSKHYVSSFDHVFCYGTMFDDKTTVIDKFKEWGAKRVDWYPYGFREDMYNSSMTEDDIINNDRDIDVVFVGTPWLKENRLIELKEQIPQIQIYGQRYLQTFLKHFLKSHDTRALKMMFVKELKDDEIVPLYQRSKLGINIHLSYGVSNLRTYQLPANGIMQICDCEDGLKNVYNIGKEVITYSDIDEAIELIRYYLDNEEARKEIAIAGYRRTMKEYKSITTFQNALRKIEAGMNNETTRNKTR